METFHLGQLQQFVKGTNIFSGLKEPFSGRLSVSDGLLGGERLKYKKYWEIKYFNLYNLNYEFCLTYTTVLYKTVPFTVISE